MRPPWQPSLPFLEQSTSCCSLNETRPPPAICQAPSKEPVVLNAQQLPHWPWSFTGVTAPCVPQSKDSGATMLSSDWCVPTRGNPVNQEEEVKPKNVLYSDAVQSANWFTESE